MNSLAEARNGGCSTHLTARQKPHPMHVQCMHRARCYSVLSYEWTSKVIHSIQLPRPCCGYASFPFSCLTGVQEPQLFANQALAFRGCSSCAVILRYHTMQAVLCSITPDYMVQPDYRYYGHMDGGCRSVHANGRQ